MALSEDLDLANFTLGGALFKARSNVKARLNNWGFAA
jgi:hypothetical protein